MTRTRLESIAGRLFDRAVKAEAMAYRANDLYPGPFGCDGWNDIAVRYNRLACRYWYARDRVWQHISGAWKLPCTCAEGGQS